MFKSPFNAVRDNEIRKMKNRADMEAAYNLKQEQRKNEVARRFVDSQQPKYSNVDKSKLAHHKMNDTAKKFLQDNVSNFYYKAASMYSKIGKVPFQGYTVSCDEEPMLNGVSYEQMLYFSRNDETILNMKSNFESAGVGLFIKEKAGRLVIMASSDKAELEGYKQQFGFMDNQLYKHIGY